MHSLAKIKTMCSLPLHAGVQRQYGTVKCNGLFFKPVEQLLASTQRATCLVTDQIVDIQTTPFAGVFNQAPYGEGQYRPVINDQRHARTVGKHPGQT